MLMYVDMFGAGWYLVMRRSYLSPVHLSVKNSDILSLSINQKI